MNDPTTAAQLPLPLESDRDFVAICGSLCEGALLAEAEAVAVGDVEDAAFWANEAHAQSAYAFAVATW